MCLAGAVVVLACSEARDAKPNDADPATAIQSQRLCDGSETARFRYTHGGGMLSRYHYYLHPLGREYFVIDGQCRYWVGENAWAGARVGTLTAEQASTLEDELHYAEFVELTGDWLTRGCMDGATWTASDGIWQVSCYCGCTDDDVPQAVAEFGRAAAEARRQLWDAGSVFDGPLRVAAQDITDWVETGGPAHDDWQSWPLSTAISAALLATETSANDPTAGLLIDDPAEQGLLRMLRADYISIYGGISADDDNGYLPVTVEGRYYALLMRDVVPWDPGAP